MFAPINRTETSFQSSASLSLSPSLSTFSTLQSWLWILLTPSLPTLVNRKLPLFSFSLPFRSPPLNFSNLSINSAWNLVGDKFSKRANETLKTLITFVEVRRFLLCSSFCPHLAINSLLSFAFIRRSAFPLKLCSTLKSQPTLRSDGSLTLKSSNNLKLVRNSWDYGTSGYPRITTLLKVVSCPTWSTLSAPRSWEELSELLLRLATLLLPTLVTWVSLPSFSPSPSPIPRRRCRTTSSATSTRKRILY